MKEKKPRTIHVQYKCKDGSRTVAATASLGLMYWYGRSMPMTPIENPKPFDVHVTTVRMAFPYDPMFLSLVVASLERAFGKAPPIPEHLLAADHYKKFDKGMDFQGVEKRLQKNTPEIVEYEQVCRDILQWLTGHGDITKIAFDEPMKGFDW